MSYEIENLKSEVQRLKNALYRKVDDEKHRNEIAELHQLIESKFSYLSNRIDDVLRRMDEADYDRPINHS